MPSRELGSLEFCVSCASRQSRGAVLHATDSRVSIKVVSMLLSFLFFYRVFVLSYQHLASLSSLSEEAAINASDWRTYMHLLQLVAEIMRQKMQQPHVQNKNK